MTYTHLTPNELVMIEAYFHQETPVAIVAKQLKRGRQTIYNVYNFLKCGGTALEYFELTFSNVVEQHLNTLNNTKKISDVVGEPKSFFLLRKKNTLVQSEPSLVQ
ncbi:hypothetical protein EfmAA818_13840 [Enterococcus faecium]|nr:hypothetical protein EfmAA818_13840 [Enterococcus faecium]